MTDHEQYIPGPASGAQVIKDGVQNDKDKWTLILVRELRHSPEKVWRALTDPVHLREWAPFETDGNLELRDRKAFTIRMKGAEALERNASCSHGRL